ncbi:MAG: hypothetical protein HY925_15905 [Elusimicrobia bacterium]|nr:hypothetical protein [Elusimicrobiota bacterium]
MKHLLLSIAVFWAALPARAQSPSAADRLLRTRNAAEKAASGSTAESAHFGAVGYDAAAGNLEPAQAVQGSASSGAKNSGVAKKAAAPAPRSSGRFSGGHLGPYPESDFVLTTGRTCNGCNAPKEGLWYFPDDVIAVPKVGKPAIVWIGSHEMLEGVRMSKDGKSIVLNDGSVVPLELTPKLPSNLSFYDITSTAYFQNRPLRIRGEWAVENGVRKFVARTIWPEDFRVDLNNLATEKAVSEEDISALVSKDDGGARTPFKTTVLWEKAGAGRAWGGKPVMGMMLNGGQGDDDETHAGHYSMFTGKFGPNGEMSDWMYDNFYDMDQYSEKGIIPSMVPMDKYMADLNSGQSWYRPTDVIVAVLKDGAIPLRIQEQYKDFYQKYYDHSVKYNRATKPCASLVIDLLREDNGWNIPTRGPTDVITARLLSTLVGVGSGDRKAGQDMYTFMRQERTRLFPRAAFEATGSDLLKLAGAQGSSVDRQLTPFEKELQENLIAILYVHLPQIPSSRAFGLHPIEDTVDYFHRVPLSHSKWKVGGPTSPRPFPPPH